MSKLTVSLLALLCAAISAAEVSKDVNELKFYYYPTSGDRRELIYQNAGSLSALKSGAPTTLLIDGFLSDVSSPMSQNLKNAILNRESNRNVIVMDWGRLSGSGLTLGNLLETASAYITVLGNVGPVGSRVADFLNFVKTTKNIDFSQIHIIGHSLGAHIAGAAGNFIQQKYGGKVARITGLDPAGPFFSLQVDKDKRLHQGDATFVDIYHTNRGTLGDSSHQTGDINVYVNGGDNQPGCEEADASGFAGYCSHSYSWRIYDAAIRSDIKACPCSGLPCQCSSNCNTQCSNPITIGARAPLNAIGAYHLIITNSFQ